ncbi:high-affinity iron transporter [Scopulibacillus darangshiensis]|uniref:High-affinity iron transporter n=1 Tax=Scopulibacillus darangshiensis TaxID=442528 RepID=A0A4R2NKE5_9BACL|nr:FTR1 family protein [Scopulibacillus darangshiensis]TCP21931.1 high-affinity iron transporter [Scopulibacillus darangshiensis]
MMIKKMFALSLTLVTLLYIALATPVSTYAASSTATSDVAKAEAFIDQAIKLAGENKLDQAKSSYQKFNDRWYKIEDGVRESSSEAYADIEEKMGQVSFSFMQNKAGSAVNALKSLKAANEKFIDGRYASGNNIKKNVSLTDFIALLTNTKSLIESNNVQEASEKMAEVKSTWLSVEGNVVSKSKSVYDSTERDMVTVSALLKANQPNTDKALKLTNQMINDLKPLAAQKGYSIWDAALIPIREGLEALLVVGALLSFSKKSNRPKARKWIIGGVSTAILASIILALIVTFVFSSISFGDNNFLIVGWTGVIAAAMLLYVSYWLHRQSHISNWTQYIRDKSEAALGTGKMFSFALLAFLAVFREGTETVLFLIGLVQHMTPLNLLLGIGLGLGTLAVIALIYIKIGVRIPMKPFFVLSSLIVFYLCVKFTGSGIHGLQLAGIIPSKVDMSLPSISLLSFYPSWYSAVPQLLLVAGALALIIYTFIKNIKNKAAEQREEIAN